jgi:Domain of unknown function (DUF4294)
LVILQKLPKLKELILILFFGLLGQISAGQADSAGRTADSVPGRIYVLQNVTRNGELLPEIQIKEVTIVGKGEAARRSFFKRYDRMVYNIKKVYPYAMIVRKKLDDVNLAMMALPDDKERKKYMKEVEKGVFDEYEDDMRDMTITQGKLLIKLIDRETLNTSYDLIKQYRGGISAAFWQGIARIFGTNLKEEYDPYGSDLVIEMIINDIEAGLL